MIAHWYVLMFKEVLCPECPNSIFLISRYYYNLKFEISAYKQLKMIALLTDLSKAFDCLLYRLLICKLRAY